MGSCIDLTDYQDTEKIQEAFSKLVSGKEGYKAIIDRKKEPKTCPNQECKKVLQGDEKFCPNCGTAIGF